MNAKWLKHALYESGMTQAELARQMKARGFAVDRAAVNKMLLEKATTRTKPRRMTPDEMLAISEITSQPLPAAFTTGTRLLSAGDHIDSEALAASLDADPDAPWKSAPPFEEAIAQVTGYIGGGSTGEVITLSAGEMETVEPVAAWWRVPREALSGFGFHGALPQHIVGWFMDGSSMEPTIQRTDVVFIDTRRIKPDPDGIFALDYGEGRTLKRIKLKHTDAGPRYLLLSDNSDRFPPLEYSVDEVKIIGRYLFRFTVY